MKWAMGGKIYMRLYFARYHGQFPTSADPELMFKAQAQAMEKFNVQMESQLKLLEGKRKKKFACYKCGDPDHAAADCPHDRSEARKLKKKRAATAAAAAAGATGSGDAGSESD